MHIWESKKKSLKKRWRCVILSCQERVYKLLSLRLMFLPTGPFLLLGFITGNLPMCHSIWKECNGLVYLQIKNNKNSNTCYRDLKAHSIWDQLIGAKVLQSWVEARESLFCSPFQQWTFVLTSDSSSKEPLWRRQSSHGKGSTDSSHKGHRSAPLGEAKLDETMLAAPQQLRQGQCPRVAGRCGNF